MQHNLSIRGLTGKYLAMVLLVSLLGLSLLAWIGRQSIDEDIARHQRFEVTVLQRQFSELIGFYQGIAAQLSHDNEIVDMLEFGDKERAVVWAREVRALVPESIGVALINTDGEILGEPLQLNLGEQCVKDLHALFSGEPVSSLPVHRANPRLAHFDVIHEVRRKGELFGLLFISFSLDTIQRRVDQLTDREQVLEVLDSEGQAVAMKGDDHLHQHHWGEQHRIAIEDTDWTLLYQNDKRGASGFLVYTLLIAGLLTVVTLGVIVLLSLRLVSLFKNDLGFIKEQLGGVYTGEEAGELRSKTLLAETSDIMGDVGELMANIKQVNARLKRLSVKDELSGLLNRRGFYEQLHQGWELSARGVTSSLVFLDIDYFKQVNDRFGHAIGDEVIVAFADSLKERCRKTDIVARLGGDEFAVILNSLQQPGQIEHWYQELVEHFAHLQQKIRTESEAMSCSVSAGAVPLDKGSYASVGALMGSADLALYQAKGEGRERIVCLFDGVPGTP